jgi:hypothetical protein
MACATTSRDPAGGDKDVWTGLKWIGRHAKHIFVRDKRLSKEQGDAGEFRRAQYGSGGINTIDPEEEANSPPPPPPPVPGGAGATLGPAEQIIVAQVDHAKNHTSFFDRFDHARFPNNGGRVTISQDPSVAGFWQMPPLPKDFINVRGADGREHPVPMKMGAIQASVLPSGKVLMVSGSSNRGDSRPMKNPPVTSQSYGFIDNTELFDPELVPLVPSDPAAARVDLAPFEFPNIDDASLVSQAEPIGKAKPTLYERPFSLPDEQAFVTSALSPEIGTLRDPKFCAQERPPGTKIFNNGISILMDPVQYCAKIADPTVNGGSGVPLPLTENATPDPGEPNIDLFCGGHMPLPDGNVLFAGGTRKAVSFTTDFTPIPFHGVKRTMVFDWKQERWRDSGPARGATNQMVNMGDGRWYPTLVELPDGKVFIIGGMNHRGEISHTLEVYDPRTRSMSQLVDFRPLGGRPMPNEPFTVLDPVASRRFDNFPRVFLTHDQPALPGCADVLHCVRLLITGDGSAEGNRDIGMNNTVYVDMDTRAFPRLLVNFVRGPQRNNVAAGHPKTHEYSSHLYSTTTYDPLTETGDILTLGGSIGKYDPLHIAQDVKQDPTTKSKILAPEASTNFNGKPDQRTESDMERYSGATRSFEPVFEHFLGDDNDVTAKVATSRLFPGSRGAQVPCDPTQPATGANICGPLNHSGMINPNVVVLPTRQLLVMGGGNHSYADPLFNPVLFTPSADPFVHPAPGGKPVGWRNEWTRNFMNPFHLPRLYHNTSLLLPDGRVFLGSGNTFISFLKGVDGFGLPIVGPGGGQANNYNNFEGADKVSGVFKTIPDPSNNNAPLVLSNLSVDLPAEQYQVELFNPPYLFFPGERPVIQGLAVRGRQTEFHPLPAGKRWIDPDHEDIVPYGSEIDLAIGALKMDPRTGGSNGRVTMIRMGGVTHAFNFSQKLHTLHAVNGGRVNPADGGVVVARQAGVGESATVAVQAPTSPRVAPPGYYMIFYVNNVGKPSEARIVRLCNQVSTASGVACAEDPT